MSKSQFPSPKAEGNGFAQEIRRILADFLEWLELD